MDFFFFRAILTNKDLRLKVRENKNGNWGSPVVKLRGSAGNRFDREAWLMCDESPIHNCYTARVAATQGTCHTGARFDSTRCTHAQKQAQHKEQQ
jgi:hypothetical protein